MEVWFTDGSPTDVHYRQQWKINKILHQEESKYQHLAIVELAVAGRALILDGIIQTTLWDEHIYHEMLTHIAMYSHPFPEKILIIGGGDGGVAREVLKHPSVKQVELVDIDEQVINLSQKYLPEIAIKLNDSKVNIIIQDGIDFVNNSKNQYDVIICDATDPFGPGLVLYSSTFYERLVQRLRNEGIIVTHNGSPLFNRSIIQYCYESLAARLSVTKVFLSFIPTYHTGPWCFIVATKSIDPEDVSFTDKRGIKTRHYNFALHRAAFVLPEDISNNLFKYKR